MPKSNVKKREQKKIYFQPSAVQDFAAAFATKVARELKLYMREFSRWPLSTYSVISLLHSYNEKNTSVVFGIEW